MTTFEWSRWGFLGSGVSVLVSGQDQIAGVDAGPGFGDATVVYLDLVRSAGEDDARGGARPAGNAQPLGLGGIAGAHGDGTSAAAYPSLRTSTATSHPADRPARDSSWLGVTAAMVRSGRPRSRYTQSLKNQRRSLPLDFSIARSSPSGSRSSRASER